MNDRYYTARTLAVFIGALGLFGLPMGAWMLTVHAPPFVCVALLLSGLVLLPLGVIEWLVPVIEIGEGRIVMRQARLRKALIAERPPEIVLEVKPHLLGWQIVAPGGERWVKGRLGELAGDGGRLLIVPARALAPAEKRRLGDALRAWAMVASP